MGDEVIFTGIAGSCSITTGNTAWPFSHQSPINFPLPANTKIYIKSGLTVGNSYQYLVSCCKSNAPKTVTVTG